MSNLLKGGVFYTGGNLKNGGCSCCNSKAEHRQAKKSAKQKEKRFWKKDQNV